MSLLELQFKLLTSFQSKDFNLVSANKMSNAPKNRCAILPIESSRVHLTPKPGVDGSDYINATWFQGFQKLREFIITQHPLKETILDFWQMVWDHNVQTIVMLSTLDSQEYDVFWPSGTESIEASNFRVKLITENHELDCTSYDLIVQSLQDDYELNVKLFQCSGWPQSCEVMLNYFDLPKMIQEHHANHGNGPIVVIDRFGGADAATFCCITALGMHLEYEEHADVYMYAKLYHNKRPGIWSKSDDYLLLYKAMQSMSPGMCILPKPKIISQQVIDEGYQVPNGSANGLLSNESAVPITKLS